MDETCTVCGKELKEGDDLYVTSSARLEDSARLGVVEICVSDTPYFTIACDECGQKISEVIESVGTEQAAPVPDTELALEAELSRVKELNKTLVDACNTAIACCEEALDDRWDRGDAGFVDMQTMLEGAVDEAEARRAKSEEYRGLNIEIQEKIIYGFTATDKEGALAYEVRPDYETREAAIDGAKFDIDYDLEDK